MKIICIGRNFAEHALELGNEKPSEPVFFLKPDTAILLKNTPFFVPDFSNNVQYEVEVVLKINRLGKNIAEKFAHKYYEEIGLGIDFTARDLQNELKEKGLPWEKAKAFDGSAVVGQKWISKKQFQNLKAVPFQLNKNGETVQNGNTSDMIFSFDEIIAHISRFMTLKIGDLIFTGTPAGVGKVNINDELKGFIGETEIFTLKVK